MANFTTPFGQGTASVAETLGEISGYSTGIGWGSHISGQTNEDLEAVIGAEPAFHAPGFLVPTRNGNLCGGASIEGPGRCTIRRARAAVEWNHGPPR